MVIVVRCELKTIALCDFTYGAEVYFNNIFNHWYFQDLLFSNIVTMNNCYTPWLVIGLSSQSAPRFDNLTNNTC